MDPSVEKSEVSDQLEASEWLISPPGARQLSIGISLGEGLKMTSEIQAKLDEFIASLLQDFIEPGAPYNCGDLARCKGYSCVLDNCKPLKKPCLVNCRIGPEPVPI